jgi:hypothetical protein
MVATRAREGANTQEGTLVTGPVELPHAIWFGGVVPAHCRAARWDVDVSLRAAGVRSPSGVGGRAQAHPRASGRARARRGVRALCRWQGLPRQLRAFDRARGQPDARVASRSLRGLARGPPVAERSAMAWRCLPTTCATWERWRTLSSERGPTGVMLGGSGAAEVPAERRPLSPQPRSGSMYRVAAMSTALPGVRWVTCCGSSIGVFACQHSSLVPPHGL